MGPKGEAKVTKKPKADKKPPLKKNKKPAFPPKPVLSGEEKEKKKSALRAISFPFPKLVEIGRIALIKRGPDEGKICCIVDVIDANRVRLFYCDRLQMFYVTLREFVFRPNFTSTVVATRLLVQTFFLHIAIELYANYRLRYLGFTQDLHIYEVPNFFPFALFSASMKTRNFCQHIPCTEFKFL